MHGQGFELWILVNLWWIAPVAFVALVAFLFWMYSA